MASQVKFLKKNKVDLSNPNISITITDSVASSTGLDIIDFIRNRNNRSAWLTTDSADSGNTTLEIDMADNENVDAIILIKHNWKAFTIQYWDGFTYQDFSAPISETVNTEQTTYFSFTEVSTTKIKIIITGTQAADVDKELYQLIVGEELGDLEAWPEIRKPKHITNRKKTTMLSGKLNVVESVGRFSCSLKVKFWNINNDLALIERLYFDRIPALMWLCGGDEEQFGTKRAGYRKEDIFMVRPTNDYSPEYVNYIYTNGLNLSVNFDEVVD